MATALNAAGPTLAPVRSHPETRSQRELEWQNQERQVDGLADGLGLALDPGIKRAVVGLQVNGFTTSQSCEGHSDHGCGAPWVDIRAPGAPGELFQDFPHKLHYIHAYNQEEAVFGGVASAHGLSAEALMARENSENTQALREEAEALARKNGQTPEYQAWVSRNDSMRSSMEQLLSDYQAAHPVPADQQLHLRVWGDEHVIRLYTGTQADLDCKPWTMGAAERASLDQRLPPSRQAMNAFADYLKERFIAAGPYLQT